MEVKDRVFKYNVSDMATFICADGYSEGCSFNTYRNTTTWYVNEMPLDDQTLTNVEVSNVTDSIRFNNLTLDNNGTTVQCRIYCPQCGMRVSVNATIIVEGQLIT